MRLAVVGCGNIAGPYCRDIARHPDLTLVGFFDLDAERAAAFAAEFGGRAFPTLEAALADAEVDLIVNLTIFEAHYRVSRAALEAGKHVYSEKPLALRADEAQDLVALAAERGLILAAAPITFLGEAQRRAMRSVREGRLGPVRLVYAEVNHARIESWHPNPAPFYAVGPMLDVGVYPLALLTALFGPAERVSAYARTLYPQRIAAGGAPFAVEAPDHYVVNLDLPNGVSVRLSANFYVGHHARQRESIEFHGDAGSLFLSSWFAADAEVLFAEYDGSYAPLAAAPGAEREVDWAVGLQELADARAAGRRAALTAEHAAHVVEVLEAIDRSADEGRPVALTSRFAPTTID